MVHKFVSTLAKEDSKLQSPKASQMNNTERPWSTNLRPATQNSVRSVRSDSGVTRPKSTNSIITLQPNVEIKKSVRIRSAPVSSLSNRKPTPGERNQRAMTKDRWIPQVDSFQKGDSRIPSPASSRASSAANLDRGNVSTQVNFEPHELWDGINSRSLSYRNQSIGLECKSMDWFLYDCDLRHERDVFRTL